MDIEKLRLDTPGVKNVIHFNNAGASLMPVPVYSSVTSYLHDEYLYGGYETAEKYFDALENFYALTAQLIHALPEEIAYMENATHAWDMAFYSIPFKPGDRMLTSVVEYASNFIAYMQIKSRKKINIEVIPQNSFGEIDLEKLEKALKLGGVKLVAITHIPTNGGLVNNAEEIGLLCEMYNALFLLDACQSVGQYPIDVRKIKCHFLSATGRKYLRGPRGTGFLYVRKDMMQQLEPHTLDLHSAEWTGPGEYRIRKDARRFEKWESNLSGKIGLAKAMEYLMNIGILEVWQRVQYLAHQLRHRLSELSSVELLDLGSVQSGLVSFRSREKDPVELKKVLTSKGVNTSVAIRNHTLLDMQSRGIEKAIRASVHYFNTEEEIDQCVEIVGSYLK